MLSVWGYHKHKFHDLRKDPKIGSFPAVTNTIKFPAALLYSAGALDTGITRVVLGTGRAYRFRYRQSAVAFLRTHEVTTRTSAKEFPASDARESHVG